MCSGLFAALTMINNDLPKLIDAGFHIPVNITHDLGAIAALIPIFCRSWSAWNNGLVPMTTADAVTEKTNDNNVPT